MIGARTSASCSTPSPSTGRPRSSWRWATPVSAWWPSSGAGGSTCRSSGRPPSRPRSPPPRRCSAPTLAWMAPRLAWSASRPRWRCSRRGRRPLRRRAPTAIAPPPSDVPWTCSGADAHGPRLRRQSRRRRRGGQRLPRARVDHGRPPSGSTRDRATFANLQRFCDPRSLTGIVLSHKHGDHWSDVESFVTCWRHTTPRYGSADPGPRRARVRERLHADPSDVLEWREAADGATERLGGLRLAFSATDHEPVTLAVRVEGGDRPWATLPTPGRPGRSPIRAAASTSRWARPHTPSSTRGRSST